jgi:capping protein (actin filament) muscle Z-line, alpha
VRVEGSQFGCLITEFNDLGGGRFADPRSKQSFKFDHLRKEASDFQPWQPAIPSLEGFRSTLENEATAYALNHYKHGICSVFAVNLDGVKCLVVCIEDHQFQPKNFWYCLFGYFSRTCKTFTI